MFIPLNGQQERKIILGLGPNDLTPRSEDKVNNIGFFEDLFGEVKKKKNFSRLWTERRTYFLVSRLFS